ncbi:MAG: MgtC/SapB family protein [Oscillospiraceae bacterium]|nr:MgtC/SapB family protein [Oscillospiraceae bacterium]
MNIITDFIKGLSELNVLTIIIRSLLAVTCGAAIGIEREIKRRAAGLRTHMLVCLGAAMVMMTNEYIVTAFGSGDPTRMAAQVVSGIGFLGAGTIIVTGSTHIRGLTTAAGMWAAASVGLAVGSGFYSGALIGTLIITIILTLLQRADRYFSNKSTYCDIYIELKDRVPLSSFLTETESNGMIIISFDKKQHPIICDGKPSFIATIHCKGTKSSDIPIKVSSFDSVEYAIGIGMQ